ncbi:MAG: hypothetical protein ACF8PN_04950 [Phycisphaerales bacterium]
MHASTADLEAILGRDLEGSEAVRAVTMLEVATRAIDAYLDGRTVDPEVLRTVCQLATRRLLERPDGVTQEQLGDFLTSYTADGILSADDRLMLDQAGAAGVRRRTYGSPRLSHGTTYLTNADRAAANP